MINQWKERNVESKVQSTKKANIDSVCAMLLQRPGVLREDGKGGIVYFLLLVFLTSGGVVDRGAVTINN